MKALIAAVCCVMMSGCVEASRQPALSAIDGIETNDLESPRHYAEFAAEAAAEKAGPRTCTIKGGTADCF